MGAGTSFFSGSLPGCQAEPGWRIAVLPFVKLHGCVARRKTVALAASSRSESSFPSSFLRMRPLGITLRRCHSEEQMDMDLARSGRELERPGHLLLADISRAVERRRRVLTRQSVVKLLAAAAQATGPRLPSGGGGPPGRIARCGPGGG